jgi:DNA mismatch repair protein MutS
MFQEYIAYYTKYRAIYGPQTAIFLAVGSFYELYDIQDIETNQTQCNVRTIVDYLGIQLSTKKGDFAPHEVGLFAGFPDYVLHKWASRLTTAGWTVVVIDQIKDHRGKVKERKVSRILSPASHVEAALSTETPYLLHLLFSSPTPHAPPQYGAALLDLTTATTYTYSGAGIGRPDAWSADMLLQIIDVFSPKEVVIHWHGELPLPDEVFFRRLFALPGTFPLRLHLRTEYGAFAKPLVRTDYLQRIYTIRSLLPPRTYLGLRTEPEELALLFLLQYAEEHCPAMIRSFHKNIPWTPESRLLCGNHTLQQLQMTGPNPQETVVGLYSHAISPMGKRHVRERLVNPLSDPTEIRTRLEEVTHCLTVWSPEQRTFLERQLRSMYDLPRIHRRLLCGWVTPSDISHLFDTYRAMEAIVATLCAPSSSSSPSSPSSTSSTSSLCPLRPPYSMEEAIAYLTLFRQHMDEEKARLSSGSTPMEITPLHGETYPAVAEKEQEIARIREEIQRLRRDVATAGSVPVDAIHVEARSQHSAGEPYGFRLASVALQQLKKHAAALPAGSSFSELKAGGWYTCTALDQLNTRLLKARDALENLWNRYRVEASAILSEAGQALWTPMEQWIAHVDVTQCIARTSSEWGFVCPTILSFEDDGDSQHSTVDIRQIRHPLVELASPHITFVRNDLRLDDTQRGLLCYGNNAIGKSTLAKSLGIAVLLAQCGAYVPAAAMTLRPFQALYSRIHNNDQLFAGLSSFAVEMSELRTILQNATPYTLVVSDEMANGTESTSATAIVASSIQWLSKHHTKFIMATHLHDLPKYIDPVQERIAIKHLHVEYDPVTQKLVYHRTLRDGQGSSIYGIEVARAMALPFDFIETALATRHRIIGSTTQQGAASSAWNSSIVRKECERCRHPICSDLEVHHVQHRATATAAGFLPDGTHMNKESNLMVICQTCHDQLHRGEFEVGPVRQTSDGVERVIVPAASAVTEEKKGSQEPGGGLSKKGRGKWTDEEVETVKTTLRMYSSLSLKSIRAYLSSTYAIEMSESVLGKLRKEM